MVNALEIQVGEGTGSFVHNIDFGRTIGLFAFGIPDFGRESVQAETKKSFSLF